jgi:hypothetical protein
VARQLLRSRVERPVTRVHRDDLPAGHPLVYLLLQRRADGPVFEGFDVHPRDPTEVVFGDGNRRGERSHGWGTNPDFARSTSSSVRSASRPSPVASSRRVVDDPSSLITRFGKITDSVSFSDAEGKVSPSRNKWAPT